MGHVVVAVGKDDPVGGPGGGIDGRQRDRHVGLAGAAETRADGDHARFEGRLTDRGDQLAPPLCQHLAPGAFAPAGRDDHPMLECPPGHRAALPIPRRRLKPKSDGEGADQAALPPPGNSVHHEPVSAECFDIASSTAPGAPAHGAHLRSRSGTIQANGP
jgi:hypothetical protein